MRARLRSVLERVARVDLDSLVAPIVLALGAEQLHPGSGLLVLGAALYLPVLLETARRPTGRR